MRLLVFISFFLPVIALADIRPLIKAKADEHGVSQDLVLAVSWVESTHNPRARNRQDPGQGAWGLMQLLGPTAAWIGSLNSRWAGNDYNELLNPELNLDLGILYLKRLLRKYSGDVRLAVAAYNAGPSRVQKNSACVPNPHHVDKVINAMATKPWGEKELLK